MTKAKNRVAEIVTKNENTILENWLKEQASKIGRNIKEADLKQQCRDFLRHLTQAVQSENFDDIQKPEWQHVRKLLSEITRSRGEHGFSPSETATFIFSLKQPLFAALRKDIKETAEFAEASWTITELLDKLGLYTVEQHQKVREEIINRQQQDMMELSTPVVSLADNILALPVIGTLDSARTQVVMESLLQRIVETGSTVAIIDITGVPTVDTLVAQHLLKTVTAARLMGADCIISGIRPQIAQTIVHLGVDLGNVTTKATLASAFKLALDRNGMAITKLNGTIKSGATVKSAEIK